MSIKTGLLDFSGFGTRYTPAGPQYITQHRTQTHTQHTHNTIHSAGQSPHNSQFSHTVNHRYNPIQSNRCQRYSTQVEITVTWVLELNDNSEPHRRCVCEQGKPSDVTAPLCAKPQGSLLQKSQRLILATAPMCL